MRNRCDEPEVVTSRASFRETAQDAPRGSRIPVEVRVQVADPFRAYRRARDSPGGFYLATTGGQSGWGYFGVEPTSQLQTDSNTESSLDVLSAALADEKLVRGDCDVPYPCGLFGWLSYDLIRELEALPGSATDDRHLPRLQFGLYDCVAAWEAGSEETLRVTACPRLDARDETYDEAREMALSLATAAIEGDESIGEPPTDEREPFVSSCGRDAFAERVRRVKEYIHDGDTFQANISQRLEAPASVHPVAAFDALRRVNPAPYSALLEFPGVDLVSASPELLLDLNGHRLRTEPIAGTRPRGSTPEEDEALAAQLRDDDKERAEHAMLVDLERNDLGKIAEYGSVEVTDYRRIDRYSEVMHLVSEVTGRRRSDVSPTDAIAAVFPGGTITGAPKPRTMEIIDELESTRRGPYTGSIGVLGFDERGTLNIVIRTLVRYGEEYHLRVGAGIVHDSIPDAEYEETLAKGKALVNAIDEALERGDGFSVE